MPTITFVEGHVLGVVDNRHNWKGPSSGSINVTPLDRYRMRT